MISNSSSSFTISVPSCCSVTSVFFPSSELESISMKKESLSNFYLNLDFVEKTLINLGKIELGFFSVFELMQTNFILQSLI